MIHNAPYIQCRLMGVGAALPEHAVSNEELVKRLKRLGVEASSAWIQERTGIENRYFASPDQKTSDLATLASKEALKYANINASQIELIIVATSTPDMIFPSTACQVQRKLGIHRCAAFDVQAVCSGFVYALTVADAMMKARKYRHALVIGAEVFSNIVDWKDRSTCVLFGDGAGAVVLSLNASEDLLPERGILQAEINADGRYTDILCTRGQIQQGGIIGDPFLRMDGQAVFKFAVNTLAECAELIMSRADINGRTLDWLIPHQANKRIMLSIAKKLDIPEGKVISVVHKHANTSAASIPLALAVAVKEGKIHMDHKLLMLGVGGGFTWGGVLATWG